MKRAGLHSFELEFELERVGEAKPNEAYCGHLFWRDAWLTLDSRKLMFPHIVRTLVVGVAGITFLAGAIACSGAAARKSKKSPDSGDLFEDDQAFEDGDDTPATTIGLGNGDAGVINVPTRPNDGGVHDARVPDANAGDAGICSGPLVADDLRIVEIMVSSKTGQGDTGEWIEVQSSRSNCSLNIKGLTISSPHGTSAFDTVTVNQDVLIPPYGFFVVADSNDALKNGGITGQVVAWGASDVLKNDGDTVELAAGGVTIDKITYPALGATPGVSFAFPWDCAWSDRATWGRWSKSVATFGSASILKGTPNQDNVDVACY